MDTIQQIALDDIERAIEVAFESNTRRAGMGVTVQVALLAIVAAEIQDKIENIVSALKEANR
jgi:hypothetical protein